MRCLAVVAIAILFSTGACTQQDDASQREVDSASNGGDDVTATPATASDAVGDGEDDAADAADLDDALATEPGASDDEAEPSESDPDDGSEVTDSGGSGVQTMLGPCCEANATPGCQDQATTACVCELIPECCTEAWSEVCALMVTQKHCEPGVRECVCGFEEGQWQLQDSCCAGEWSNLCRSTAVQKCGAAETCF